MKSPFAPTSRWIVASTVLAACWHGPIRAQLNYETPYHFKTLAGSASSGSRDGPGPDARLYQPGGLASDTAGNLYFADTGNSTIRKISRSGVVTTLAGKAGSWGDADGPAAEARFSGPYGVAMDSTGNIYVTGGGTIRRISAAGQVTTLAGSPGNWGSADGTGREARFYGLAGIGLDPSGNVYVTDWLYHTIRKISPAGVVTTLAGYPELNARPAGFNNGYVVNPQSVDGIGSEARFSGPEGLGVDQVGNLFVTDGGNIRRITPTGTVTTFATRNGGVGVVDLEDEGAFGLTVDSAGGLLVTSGSSLRRISPGGIVTMLARQLPNNGEVSSMFGAFGVTADYTGNAYVSDPSANVIRRISASGEVTTVAGLAPNESYGLIDGNGSAARFRWPNIVFLNSAGTLLVGDQLGAIRRVSPTGNVTTLNLSAPDFGGFTKAPGFPPTAPAPFNLVAVTQDDAGNTYAVSNALHRLDTGPGPAYQIRYTAHAICKIAPSGLVTVLAGDPTVYSTKPAIDGAGRSARFADPSDISMTAAGDLLVTDGHAIRRISPGGAVTTWVGSIENPGHADGLGDTARFFYPGNLADDSAGNVYVTDTLNYTIRRITPEGMVTTLAGKAYERGIVDGNGENARFDSLVGLATDDAGNVYVMDSRLLRKISPTGKVTTLAGGGLTGSGSEDGIGRTIQFGWGSGVAADQKGNVYVADRDNNTIRFGRPAGPPIITSLPQSLIVGSGGNAVFSVTADGAPDPTYQWYFNGSPFSGATTNTLSFTNARPTDAGEYTVVVTNELGSVTSAKATLAVTTPAPPPAPAAKKGGGGAPSYWFVLALASLGLLRSGWVRLIAYSSLLLPALAASVWAQSDNSAPYAFSHLAGPLGGSGNADGTGAAARFSDPNGLAVDSNGNVYVTDSGSATIRKVTPTGVVTSLPLLGGQAPVGVAVDRDGTVYVSASRGIQRVSPEGTVTILVQVQDFPGSLVLDQAGNLVQNLGFVYDSPGSLAVDHAGNLLFTVQSKFSDQNENYIVKMTVAGTGAHIHAGTSLPGSVDGAYSQRFNNPSSVAVDHLGNVYVADEGNHTIRKIFPSGYVTTLAGTAGASGQADGNGAAARFNSPRGVAVDLAGNVYVADTGNGTIRRITAGGAVTTLAGSAGVLGSVNGIGAAARFHGPRAVAADDVGNIYVGDGAPHAYSWWDTHGGTIRKITPDGAVTTLAGLAGDHGNADGIGTDVRFDEPQGVAVDKAGGVFIADTANHTIRRISSAGVVTTFAGAAGKAGSADGLGPAARFNRPTGVAADPAGNIYVADHDNDTIRKITPDGMVTTLAGTAGKPGIADGTGAAAAFHHPVGVAFDRAGNLYVTDGDYFPGGDPVLGWGTIRKVTPEGFVTTVAGNPTIYEDYAVYNLGIARPGPFKHHAGLAVDEGGNIYVADRESGIWKVTPVGAVALLKVSDENGNSYIMSGASGVVVDNAGNIYVLNSYTSRLLKITPMGLVITLIGQPIGLGESIWAKVVRGGADGVGPAVQFNRPTGLAMDHLGNLYVADTGNNAIRKGQLATAPVITTQPQSVTVTTGSSVQFAVSANGVPAPTYQWYFNGHPFSGATTNTLSFTNAHSTDAGDYTVVVTNELGSVTSTKATLAVTAPAPPPAAKKSGGGGGVSLWFPTALLLLSLGRGRGHW